MRHMHPAPRYRGFTLMEMMVVVAIIGVLAALSVAALNGIGKRNAVANTFIEVQQGVRRTRAEALGRGVRTAFVVDTEGKRWWSLEANAGVNLDVWDPSAPGIVIAQGTLPNEVSFGPAAGLGAKFPAPFAAIPVLPAQSPAPNLAYCSFCRTGGKNKGFGVIQFEPEGRAVFTADAPVAVGQQLTMTGGSGAIIRTMSVAVLARSGLVEIFE